MKWEHLRAFVWLRWRLRFNQVRKGGVFNAIILGLLAALGAFAALGAMIAMFFVGFLALATASPTVIMFVWDGLVLTFLFVWMTGLVTELQKSESLSLTKFLHLPVSVTGVFLINYLSSLFSVTMLIFGPAMLALVLGMTLSRGPIMLLQLPLVIAMLFMATALTYQFQGWLAALMVNKRRRRTIVVVITMSFVLLAQLPNLANLVGGPMFRKKAEAEAGEFQVQLNDLQNKLVRKEITQQEWQRQEAEIKKARAEKSRVALQEFMDSADQTARLVGLVFPPGWLPMGAVSLAEGGFLAALLGTLGMSAIGGLSFWRSYRTTLRLYTGQFTTGKRPSGDAVKPAAPVAAEKALPTGNPLEKEIRWLSEQATVVALSSLRSLLRAPEAKMMLLSPVLMIVVFGSILFTRSAEPAEALRPFMASGAVAMILFTLSQLIGNQFGFDRNGFRVFVLCPAPRRQILLGKNAAVAPMVLTLSLLAVVAIQVIYPMPVDIFLSLLPQVLSMFLLYCLIGNLASILAPLRIAPGTMKPTSVKTIPVLAHVGMMLLLPVVLSVTMFPLTVQLIFRSLAVLPSAPVAAILSLFECLLICVLYYFAVGWEGDLLQSREQKILEAVVNKEE